MSPAPAVPSRPAAASADPPDGQAERLLRIERLLEERLLSIEDKLDSVIKDGLSASARAGSFEDEPSKSGCWHFQQRRPQMLDALAKTEKQLVRFKDSPEIQEPNEKSATGVRADFQRDTFASGGGRSDRLGLHGPIGEQLESMSRWTNSKSEFKSKSKSLSQDRLEKLEAVSQPPFKVVKQAAEGEPGDVKECSVLEESFDDVVSDSCYKQPKHSTLSSRQGSRSADSLASSMPRPVPAAGASGVIDEETPAPATPENGRSRSKLLPVPSPSGWSRQVSGQSRQSPLGSARSGRSFVDTMRAEVAGTGQRKRRMSAPTLQFAEPQRVTSGEEVHEQMFVRRRLDRKMSGWGTSNRLGSGAPAGREVARALALQLGHSFPPTPTRTAGGAAAPQHPDSDVLDDDDVFDSQDCTDPGSGDGSLTPSLTPASRVTAASRSPKTKKSSFAMEVLRSRRKTRSLERSAGRSAWLQCLWLFFEEPQSSWMARIFHQSMFVLLFASAIVPVMETLPDPVLSKSTFFALGSAADSIFLGEALMRWLVCPGCLVFLKSFYNILDLAVVIPFVVRAYLYFATDLSAEVLQAGESFIVCTVPVMRLIKALKAQHNFTLLVVTLNAVWEPLMVPFFMLLITCLSSSSLLFVFEPRDNIPSVPNAMWLVALTVSTVGYGDVYPVTDVGRLIIIQVIFVGVLCMAMPISIVGAAFTETWRSRTKIIILRRIRSRLLEWEYGEEDLRLMFNAFDASKAGELDFKGFEAVIAEMRLGLDTGQVGRLFDLFDADGSGSVDCDEFLEGIGLQDPHKNEGDVF